MIAFAVAAALLMDTTPKPKAELIPVKTTTEQTQAAPSGAALQNVAVTLECTARASGRVEDCRVLGETHPGLGFGDAAIALMRDAEVAPGPRDIQFARTIQFMP
jgi:TonB family protein